MTKVGRPPKENARRQQYRVRLSEEEGNSLATYCEKNKISISEFIRNTVMETIKKGE